MLVAVFIMVGLIAWADWAVGDSVSLGPLYMLPMAIAGTVMQPPSVIVLAVVCSGLRAWADTPEPPTIEFLLRFAFALVSYTGAGLFVIALMRNRVATMEHLTRIHHEQERRQEAEEQLSILVESSPAAIITIGEDGTVLAANRAAGGLLMLPSDQTLTGREIARYFPVLGAALQFHSSPNGSGDHAALRAAAQCQAFRDNGEIFLANLWFSSWS